MSVLKTIFAAFLLILGLPGVAVSLLAIIDPIGTKMADDGDPFGVPPSVMGSFVLLVVFVAISTLGGYLLSRLRSSKHDA